MLRSVHLRELEIEELTLKYLEPGHTFMSAYAFHAAVERSVKNRNVYTFSDFVDRVERADFGTVATAVLARQDIFVWPDDIDRNKICERVPRFYLRVWMKEHLYAFCYIVMHFSFYLELCLLPVSKEWPCDLLQEWLFTGALWNTSRPEGIFKVYYKFLGAIISYYSNIFSQEPCLSFEESRSSYPAKMVLLRTVKLKCWRSFCP